MKRFTRWGLRVSVVGKVLKENVVRVLPPLNVKKIEINQALQIINKVCSELK